MSIQNFYTVAQNRDFARLFQFRISEFGPIIFSPEHYAYVESASLPGRSITNIPVTYMGMDFNTPGTVKYTGSANYTVQFRCDQMYDIRAALEASMFGTFDESTSMGSYGTPGERYKLVLELFDKQLETIRTYTLFGVWVQSLGDVSYDVKDVGQIQTVAATLAYQYWRVKDSEGATDNGSRPFAALNTRTKISQNSMGFGGAEVRPSSWGAAPGGFTI